MKTDNFCNSKNKEGISELQEEAEEMHVSRSLDTSSGEVSMSSGQRVFIGPDRLASNRANVFQCRINRHASRSIFHLNFSKRKAS